MNKMRSSLVYVAISMFVLGTCIQPKTTQSFQFTAFDSLESSLQKRNRLPRDTKSTESPLENDDCGSSSEVKSSDLNKDPFAEKSNMTHLFLDLLHEFGSYCKERPSHPEDFANFRTVLKMELITIFTGNHLVLPISDGQTEGVLSEKAKWIFNKWFDITQAEEVNDKLTTHLQAMTDRYFLSEANVTVDIRLIKDILTSYNVTPTLVPPLVMVSRIPPPNVYFPLEDLVEKKPFTGARFAEWLLNFDIRKFILHLRILYHATKPVDSLFMSTEYPKYWDQRYDPLLRAILERAKTRKEMRCIYKRALNEFARYDFKADDYPQKMMKDFKETLVFHIFMEDPELLLDIVAQAKVIQNEEWQYRLRVGRYRFNDGF